MSNTLSSYVKEMRKQFGLTQVDLAAKSGVGLRFVRELEQGKETLRLDKVNQVHHPIGDAAKSQWLIGIGEQIGRAHV